VVLSKVPCNCSSQACLVSSRDNSQGCGSIYSALFSSHYQEHLERVPRTRSIHISAEQFSITTHRLVKQVFIFTLRGRHQ